MGYFIDRMISAIRRWADEPSENPKYDQDALIEMIEQNFQVALADLNCLADNPIKARMTLSIVSGTQVYLLPPSVEKVVRLAELDNSTGLPSSQWVQRPESCWRGGSFRLEGRLLRLDPAWTGDAFDVELEYIPNGDFRLHYGSGTAALATPTSFVLAEAPAAGELDTRENAYVGAVLRTFGTYIQERTITAYDRTTRTCTVSPAFDPALDGAVNYEVVPVYGRLIEAQVALHCAEQIMASAGQTRKHALLERQHAKVKRAVQVQLSKMQDITGDHFDTRTMYDDRWVA